MSDRGALRRLSTIRRQRDADGVRRLRLAEADDLTAAARVWAAALADYLGRLGQPTFEPDLEPIRRLFAHFLETDPDRFWVATARRDERPAPGDVGAHGERIAGFGSATVRGGVWFLGMLFVDPAEQARGVGRALLDRVLAGAEGLTLGTATDSAQPISNALYARLGIVPRLPVLHLAGRPERRDALPRLPDGAEGIPFERLEAARVAMSVDALDERLLGHARRRDHDWLARDGRVGVLYTGPSGEAIGYGYTTRVGRVGPVAALEPAQLAPLVGHLLGVVPPTGAQSLWVPGDAAETVSMLLRSGFMLEPFPALLCWTRPIAPFDRYLPISLALI